MITFNSQQEQAMKLINQWYNTKWGDPVFCLSGRAGTGKTTLAKYAVYDDLNLLPRQVAFVAPTGKAATVLASKGCLNATTIHQLIYRCVEKIDEKELDGKKIKIRKSIFIKKPSLDSNIKLIVCDEVSMVSNEMLADLISFGIKLLLLGDRYQLPPVKAKMNQYIADPDYELTEIMRQSKGNSILDIATLAINGEYIKHGVYGDNVAIMSKNYLGEDRLNEYLINADMVLCGRNVTRIELNRKIRELKGFQPNINKLPLENEKIIGLNNSWETFLDDQKNFALVNGTTGTVFQSPKIMNDKYNIVGLNMISDTTNSISELILCDGDSFGNLEYTYFKKAAFILPNNRAIYSNFERMKKDDKQELLDFLDNYKDAVDEKQVNTMDFGSAISVHKSQGSEAKSIVLFDESYCFGQDKNLWLYTGITRASDSLIIIR